MVLKPTYMQNSSNHTIRIAQKIKQRFGINVFDQSLCDLVSRRNMSTNRRSTLVGSIKNAFASMGGVKKKTKNRGQSMTDPYMKSKIGRGIYTVKEKACKGRSGRGICPRDQLMPNRNFTNIDFISSVVDSMGPYPTDCFPQIQQLASNIKATVKHTKIESPFITLLANGMTSEPGEIDSDTSQASARQYAIESASEDSGDFGDSNEDFTTKDEVVKMKDGAG